MNIRWTSLARSGEIEAAISSVVRSLPLPTRAGRLSVASWRAWGDEEGSVWTLAATSPEGGVLAAAELTVRGRTLSCSSVDGLEHYASQIRVHLTDALDLSSPGKHRPGRARRHDDETLVELERAWRSGASSTATKAEFLQANGVYLSVRQFNDRVRPLA